MKALRVYFENHLVGVLSRTEELTLAFSYEESWQKSDKSFPLSLAMPLEKKDYGNRITLSFFENLLPEGEILETLERTHHVKGPFEFLREFGHDCAGAIIVTDDKNFSFKERSDQMAVIDMDKIDSAIREHESVAVVVAESNSGYLSLAGAQDKFAAIYQDEKFYLPTHGAPTTHIVKVPIWRSGVKDSVFNEYYCMQLAKAVGINVPNCFIVLREQPLFVIERYDRMRDENGAVHRIHQQDFCQAQAMISDYKYEAKGGPSLKDDYNLVMQHVTITKRLEALNSFIDWICFNLLIGNNDSHSKNISFLLRQGKIELAPFYDLLSTAIYPKLKPNFSFKIGDRDLFHEIGKNQIEALEKSWQIKRGTFTARLQAMQDQLHACKDQLAHEILVKYPQAKTLTRINELIVDRSRGLKNQKAIV
jgi:serine/threonine-protein kinase HipA